MIFELTTYDWRHLQIIAPWNNDHLVSKAVIQYDLYNEVIHMVVKSPYFNT